MAGKLFPLPQPQCLHLRTNSRKSNQFSDRSGGSRLLLTWSTDSMCSRLDEGGLRLSEHSSLWNLGERKERGFPQAQARARGSRHRGSKQGRQRLVPGSDAEEGEVWKRGMGEVTAAVSAYDGRIVGAAVIEGAEQLEGTGLGMADCTRLGTSGRVLQGAAVEDSLCDLDFSRMQGESVCSSAAHGVGGGAAAEAGVTGRGDGRGAPFLHELLQKMDLSVESMIQEVEGPLFSTLEEGRLHALSGMLDVDLRARHGARGSDDTHSRRDSQEFSIRDLLSASEEELSRKGRGPNQRSLQAAGKAGNSREMPERLKGVHQMVQCAASSSELEEGLAKWRRALSPWDLACVLRHTDDSWRAFSFFCWFKEWSKPKAEPCMVLVQKAAERGEGRLVERIVQEAEGWGVEPDKKLFTAIISSFARSKEPGQARQWFERMKARGIVPDRVAFNAVAAALAKGDAGLASIEQLVLEMRIMGLSPDCVTYTANITALAGSGMEVEAASLLQEARDSGVLPDLGMYGAALKVMGDAGLLEPLLSVLSCMLAEGVGLDAACCSSVLGAVVRSGSYAETADVLRILVQRRCPIDGRAFSNVVLSLGRSRRWEEAQRFLQLMDEYGVGGKEAAYRSLLVACCEARDVRNALDVFERMEEREMNTTAVDYIHLIALLGDAGLREAVDDLVLDMRERGFEMSHLVYTALIDVYGKMGRMDAVLDLVSEMQCKGVQGSVVTCNVLLRVFVKQKMWAEVETVLETMKIRGMSYDKFTYSILISGYGRASKARKALLLYEKMKQEKCKPDLVVFGALVHSLARRGKVREVEEILLEMEASGLTPDEEILGNILELYEKVGLVEKADEVKRRIQGVLLASVPKRRRSRKKQIS